MRSFYVIYIMYKGRIAEETVNPNGFDKEGFLKQRLRTLRRSSRDDVSKRIFYNEEFDPGSG